MAKSAGAFRAASENGTQRDNSLLGAIARFIQPSLASDCDHDMDDEAAYGYIADQVARRTNTLPQLVVGLWDSFREKQNLPYWMDINRAISSLAGENAKIDGLLDNLSTHVVEEKRKMTARELHIMVRNNHVVWDHSSESYVRRYPPSPNETAPEMP